MHRLSTKTILYAEEHEWEQTRYAGVFVYVIALITQNKWLRLVMGHFGNQYMIFIVFVLMVVHNIRSIEQLKNIYSREAGIILGIKKLAKPAQGPSLASRGVSKKAFSPAFDSVFPFPD